MRHIARRLYGNCVLYQDWLLCSSIRLQIKNGTLRLRTNRSLCGRSCFCYGFGSFQESGATTTCVFLCQLEPRRIRPLPNLWVATPSRRPYIYICVALVIALDLGHKAINCSSFTTIYIPTWETFLPSVTEARSISLGHVRAQAGLDSVGSWPDCM